MAHGQVMQVMQARRMELEPRPCLIRVKESPTFHSDSIFFDLSKINLLD